jgi:AcrR family transcriptional regulator
MEKDTRSEIMKSAIRLFSENNYHAVSMKEIAQGAGVSKGTLYWYFDSKDELFKEIAFMGIDYFNQGFKKISEFDKRPDKKIYCLIEYVVKTITNHLNMLNIFRNNVELLDGDFKDKVHLVNNENIQIISQILKEAHSAKLVKAENPTEISMLILSVLFNPHYGDILNKKENVQNRIDFIYNFIMHGISRKEN